jgi:hypothetical protein
VTGRRPRRWALAGLGALVVASSAALAAPAAAAASAPDGGSPDVPVTVAIPGTGAFEVVDAELTWGLNLESGGGAFFGGCNFLSAGVAGDAGSSRLWTAADGFYRTQDGAVTVEKPDAAGAYGQPTWATKCQNPAGVAVTAATANPDNFTRNRVRIDGGTGSVDQAAGTATIRWTGSFTVVFYGGLTYWTATDPVLTIQGGTGTLTATASGYGADMDDTSRWVPLPGRTVTLARLHDVGLDDGGLTVVPDYLGVAVDTGPGTPQPRTDATNAAYWGSFPQDFVDFQVLTGQSSYWYTSGGARDAAKPATRLTVSYDAAAPVLEPSSDGVTTATGGTPTNRVVLRPPAAGGTVLAVPGAGNVAADGAASGPPAATGPGTVLAARPLIVAGDDEPGGPTAPQVAALGGLLGLVLAAGAGLGFVKGWLVVPWLR